MEMKDILREERKKHGYTQKQVADILVIGRVAYTQYETGKSLPPIDNLLKLAELYKVSLDYLTGRYS